MDLMSNVFYRTHFDVYPVKEDWNVFIEITKYIINWCQHKAQKTYGVSLDWNWRQFRSFGRFDSRGFRALTSSFHDPETDAHYWAAKIFELNSAEGFADRVWISEFGIEQVHPDHATFSYTVMYEDRQNFIGPLQLMPLPNTPSVVNYLLSDRNVICRSGSVPLSLNPTELLPESLPAFQEYLCDSQRRCPILLLNLSGDSPHLLEPKKLASSLAGNAVVYFCRGSQIEQAFSERIGGDLFCPERSLRVYATLFRSDNPDERFRHLFFTDEYISAYGPDTVYGFLRRALCQNIQNFTAQQLFRYSDCTALYAASKQKSTIRQLREQATDIEFLYNDESRQLQETKSELEQVEELYNDEAQKLEKAKSELEQKDYEIQRYTQLYASEKRKAEALNPGSGSPDGSVRKALQYISTMDRLPQTPREVVDLFLALHSDKIAFTERGLDSLKSCQAGPELVWNTLYAMATTLRDIYLSPESLDPVNIFESQTNFKLGLCEGSETRRNRKIMNSRIDTYNGESIDITPHVGYGSFKGDHDKNSIRVYYAYYPNDQKIVIGSCGKHLDNHSTRKRS